MEVGILSIYITVVVPSEGRRIPEKTITVWSEHCLLAEAKDRVRKFKELNRELKSIRARWTLSQWID